MKSRFLIPLTLLLLISAISACAEQPFPTPNPTRTAAPPGKATPTGPPFQSEAGKVPLEVQILGCRTSIDLSHGFGEVTNAYVSLKNSSTVDLTSVCATINASDEGRIHPEKTRCTLHLPVGFQLVEKLVVDTRFQATTSLQAVVTSKGEVIASTSTVCREMDKELLAKIQELLGKPLP